jgi:hypothetical protein
MVIFRAKNTLLREEHGQMARAKRHFLPGHVWHITHRCHKKEGSSRNRVGHFISP